MARVEPAPLAVQPVEPEDEHKPGVDDSEPKASAEMPTPISVDGESPARQKVVLRVEVASKTQARIITYSVIALNLAFVGAAIGLLAGQGTFKTVGDLRSLYRAQLVLGSICLGLEVLVLLWLASGVRRSKREHRIWSNRQKYFGNTAAILAGLATVYSTTYVAALADVLAEPNCGYPWLAMAGLEFVRRFCFSTIMLFLLVRVHNMKLWRGDGALDMDPDRRLLVDRPFRDKARSHIIVACIWALLVAMAALNLYSRINQYNRGARQQFTQGCSLALDDLVCKSTPTSTVAAILSFVAVLAFVAVWIQMARRALGDHKLLPYCRYKDTSIFIRVQMRIVGPVQAAVLLSVVFLELVPSLQGNCMSAVNVQLGNLPMELSLALAAVVLAVLYMPTSSTNDSSLQQALLQEFSWTQASMAEDMERRNRQLAASQAATKLGEQDDSLVGYLEFMPGMLAQGMGKLAQVADPHDAAAQLRAEPIFCMETTARLFYWTRLAYRNDEALDYKWINGTEAKRLFNLQHVEALWDTDTDTHCVIGWSDTQAVVAFRGTSSMQNTMTDLKAWRVAHQPRRYRRGRLVGVHAGFYKAWVHNDFNRKVLSKLDGISKAATAPLRVWVTGHSLGGALAVLASLDIHKQHPDSQITTYTFGCPRVGNNAFADEYNEGVPDTWAIVNGTDPIAWIPKIGFKRVGKRVTIDSLGNLLIRPSYFEVSVMQRGNNPKHHMTGGYGLSLAAIIKSQFSATKCLPGGAEGATQLAQAVDLSTTLVLTGMDLEGLKDPARLPLSSEKLDRDAQLAAAAAGKPGIKLLPQAPECCGAGGVTKCFGLFPTKEKPRRHHMAHLAAYTVLRGSQNLRLASLFSAASGVTSLANVAAAPAPSLAAARRFTASAASTDADVAVIGAGVVGLAVARELALAGRSLYYQPGSLKARLCVEGREILYSFCQRHGVPHSRLGKLVVATSDSQLGALHALAAQGAANGVSDLRLLTADEVAGLEPAVCCVAGLLSPSTGIVDSHSLMAELHRQFEAAGGTTALHSRVEGGSVGAPLQRLCVRDANSGDQVELCVSAVVNAAGLHAQAVAASLDGMPPAAIPPLHLAKGSYFSLAPGALDALVVPPGGGAKGRPSHSSKTALKTFSHLVYPLPDPGTAGLGTHLTVDLSGGVRFGPDVEWLPPGTEPRAIDYSVNVARAQSAYATIRAYLPHLPDGALEPAYSGVRPKVAGPGQPAGDFVVQGPEQHCVPGLVHLFGIESPGLTASLALAQHVAAQLCR
ncbi:L-2-hydroxyglutarate dehydrogenase [Chlorella vulgaris]